MDYEVYEPSDDMPLSVAYSRMFNCGFNINPKPAYAVEVNERDEQDLHPAYFGDVILPAAG